MNEDEPVIFEEPADGEQKPTNATMGSSEHAEGDSNEQHTAYSD